MAIGFLQQDVFALRAIAARAISRWVWLGVAMSMMSNSAWAIISRLSAKICASG
jgi:hypothetical protein